MSDIAKPHPPGKEIALGGQTGGVVAVNGQELATVVNAGLAHAYPGDGLSK